MYIHTALLRKELSLVSVELDVLGSITASICTPEQL